MSSVTPGPPPWRALACHPVLHILPLHSRMLCRFVLIFWVQDLHWVLLISSSCSSSSSSMIDSMSSDVCLDMDGLAAFRTCPLSSSSTSRQDVSDDANSFNFSVFSSSHFGSKLAQKPLLPKTCRFSNHMYHFLLSSPKACKGSWLLGNSDGESFDTWNVLATVAAINALHQRHA